MHNKNKMWNRIICYVWLRIKTDLGTSRNASICRSSWKTRQISFCLLSVYDERWLILRKHIVVLTEICEGDLPDLSPDISVREMNQINIIAISCNCFFRNHVFIFTYHVGAPGSLIIRCPGQTNNLVPLKTNVIEFFQRRTGMFNI